MSADISTEPEAQSQCRAESGRWNDDQWQLPPPKAILRGLQTGDVDRQWQTWNEYLAARSKPVRLINLLPGKSSQLLWSLPDPHEHQETLSLIRLLHSLSSAKVAKTNMAKGADTTQGDAGGDGEVAEQVSPWLAESSEAGVDITYALQCVAWAWSLESLAAHCPAVLWWELYDHLLAASREADNLDVRRQPLESVLLTGELPLALGCSFPERIVSTQLIADAKTNLSQSLTELLDGEGMPHAAQLGQLRALLGCWTRCRAVMENNRKLRWSDEAEEQYEWLVTQTLRMTRPDGSHVFTSGQYDAAARHLLDAAIDLGGDEADDEVADYFLPKRSDSYIAETEWPAAAYTSEWSALAVLRTNWSKKARQLVVTYPQGKNRVELSWAAKVIMSGEWAFELTAGKRKLVLDSDAEWEEVAWESDGDVDFLELELDITPALKIQRSFLLARKDQFLIVADAILGEEPQQLHYCSRLPLHAEVTADTGSETREICLRTGKLVARALPLALPEWRTDPRVGCLEVEDGHLVLEQTGERSLFAPLFIDLSGKRAKKQLTWRQLSVGEFRKNLSRDIAAGFRVQIGNEQWLIYRSLTPAANRTLIGQNLMCEFHVSRFLDTGDVEELIEIQ